MAANQMEAIIRQFHGDILASTMQNERFDKKPHSSFLTACNSYLPSCYLWCPLSRWYQSRSILLHLYTGEGDTEVQCEHGNEKFMCAINWAIVYGTSRQSHCCSWQLASRDLFLISRQNSYVQSLQYCTLLYRNHIAHALSLLLCTAHGSCNAVMVKYMMPFPTELNRDNVAASQTPFSWIKYDRYSTRYGRFTSMWFLDPNVRFPS